MEISKSISFLTEDPRWQQKLLIGTGVVIASTIFSSVLIGVIGFLILAGYCVRLLQNVRDGQPYPLPEWDQWGEDLARGFKLAVAIVVWCLPIIILLIPVFIGGPLTDNNNGGLQFIGGTFLFCGFCLTFIYGLLILAVQPAITIAFAKREDIGDALQWRDIIGWTQINIGQVLVVSLVYIAASIALSIVGWIVGLIICLVGIVVTVPLSILLTALFQHHLYGQLAYAYPYPTGGGGADPTLMNYTPPTEMAPGVTPMAPPAGTSSDTPVGDSTDYPDSGVDNPAPPPAA